MKYAFFPGCTLEAAAAELMTSTLKVAEALGISLKEIDNWTCCGASHSQAVDRMTALTVNARNIALAEQMGLPILTVCNTCTLMLRKAKFELDQDPELKDKVNSVLKEIGLEYKGTAEITHLLWVIIKDLGLDALKKKVKTPLKNLKVANFYGCHIIRPQGIMGFEDYLNPRSMEMITEALGATPVDFDRRLSCCGFHAMFPAEEEVQKITGLNCLSAKKAGADCIVTPCPLCHIQLDMYQPDSQKKFSEDITLPILHLPQLVGLALGFNPYDLGIKRHVVDVMPAISKVL